MGLIIHFTLLHFLYIFWEEMFGHIRGEVENSLADIEKAIYTEQVDN